MKRMRDPLKKYRKTQLKLKRIHLLIVLGTFIIISPLVLVLNTITTKAVDFTWTQTDWSGGVGAGNITTTVNTYLDQTSTDTSNAGSFTLGQISGWWNNSWIYRRSFVVNNASGSTQTDYQVKFRVNTLSLVLDGKLQNDCDDIRFVTTGGTNLNYWRDEETACNTTNTDFWVKIPSLGVGDTTIYVYYGNNSATSISSGDLTFQFFDGFDGASLDSAKWSTNVTGAITGTVTGGYYQITDATHVWMYNVGVAGSQTQIKYGFSDNIAVEWKQEMNSTGPAMGQVGFGFISSSNLTTAWSGYEDGHGVNVNCTRMTYSTGVAGGSSSCPDTSRVKLTLNGTSVKSYYNDVLLLNSTLGASTKAGFIAAGYPAYGFVPTARFYWLFIRKNAVTEPTVGTISAEQTQTSASGELTSQIYDAQLASNWGNLSFTSAGGSTSVRVRTSNSSSMSGAPSFGTCNTISSNTDISSNNCVTDGHRYIQYNIALSFSSGSSPVFSDISITYSPADSTRPTTNATNIAVAGMTSGDWRTSPPTITWTAGADNAGGSGILGYCISLDEVDVSAGSSSALNPELAAGKLTGIDDGVSTNSCPYIVSGTSVNLSSITGLTLTSGKKYYFSIKALDLAGNVWTGASNLYQDLIWFRYDDTPPNPPSFISMPSNFISTKDVTITWPTSSGAASDSHSGLAGLQYKIGSGGTWYGNLRNGNQDLTDLLLNNGTYTTDVTVDYPLLQEGVNVIYFRALDNAGNPSAQTISGALKLNTVAPLGVENLSVTPSNNTTNSYAFSWDEPGTFSGSAINLTYCYTINTLPTVNTCQFTGAGITSLSADSYATQPGTNNFYVVAKDEAGNINYDTYEGVTFTYSGSAPGIPSNISTSDISNKELSDWKLALTWNVPTDVGAGISNYRVYRSTTNTTCSGNFGAFTQVSTVSGTSFIDTGLSQQDYYYCVKACDSANNCSAVSSTSTSYPEGKYTSPANMVSEPVVIGVTTKKAVISWSTDRRSDSKIQYGLSENTYFTEETSISAQVTSHTITLNNLQAGTTYFYRAKWTDEDGNTGTSMEKSFTTSPSPTVINARAESVGISSALIKFTTEGAYKAILSYGIVNLTQSTQINTSPENSSYVIPLTGLVDNTEYTFKLTLFDLDNYEYGDALYKFKTLPRPRVSDVQIEEVKGTAQPTIKINWKSNTNISSIVTFYPASLPNLKSDIVDINLVKDHEILIKSLLADTRYVLVVRGIDGFGNEALSSEYNFTTATDSRPPLISNLNVETSITNSSEVNNAQIIVSWTTDELTTSQVLFAEGISENVTQSTTEDKNLKYNHVVVISGLNPSLVYTVKAVSRDSQRNETQSADNVTVTPSRTDSALDLILDNLSEIFGI